MRVIKNTTLEYQSFYESLQNFTRQNSPRNELKLVSYDNFYERGNMLEKYSHFLQNFLSFEKLLKGTEELSTILTLLRTTLKRTLTLKDANIFFFDDKRIALQPLDDSTDPYETNFINNSLKEGILDWIFETNKPALLPELFSFTANGSKLNRLIFPIFDGRKKKGVLSVLTPLTALKETAPEYMMVDVLLGLVLSKIHLLQQKAEINSLYHELQTYQAKLTNDFKLSAIGELTSGVVEEILTPLQVIVSCADIMGKEQSDAENKFSNTILMQVKKVENVVNRLVKFAEQKEEKIKIKPCNLNDLINDYYNVVNSSLQNNNYECILDLENNIPPVISHPNYIHQLLTNAFGILNISNKKGGGILIQTKYLKENISVRIITSDFLPHLNGEKNDKSNELSMNIISSLMKRHEGMVNTYSDEAKGSTIILTFPLKRKLRQ